MAFCINCGNQVPDGTKFCPTCGTPIAAPAQPQQAPVQQQAQTYTAPAQPQQPAKPAKAPKPPKQPKQPGQGGGKSKLLIFIIGGAVLGTGLIVGLVFLVLHFVGGAAKAAGDGTALTTLVDSMAATYYVGDYGYEDEYDEEDDEYYEEDEAYDEDEDYEEDEEGGDASASAGGEQLFQGYIYATLPDGFEVDPYGSEGSFFRSDDSDVILDISSETGSGGAAKAAEDDVTWWVENGGEKGVGYEVDGEIKAGEYTWTIEHFPWHGEVSSAKFYADVDENHYLIVTSFLMNEDDQDVIDFLSSIHLKDGDPDKLRSEWLDSLKD